MTSTPRPNPGDQVQKAGGATRLSIAATRSTRVQVCLTEDEKAVIDAIREIGYGRVETLLDNGRITRYILQKSIILPIKENNPTS